MKKPWLVGLYRGLYYPPEEDNGLLHYDQFRGSTFDVTQCSCDDFVQISQFFSIFGHHLTLLFKERSAVMQLPVSSAARFTSTQVESRKPRYMGIIISHCKDPY